MNSYEKVHEILGSLKAVVGSVTANELLEKVYEVIREEYEHGISDGYEKGYKDGVKALPDDPSFMPPM